nr:hypothetical protein HK105_006220 [Polyrhizophydium stewartii]
MAAINSTALTPGGTLALNTDEKTFVVQGGVRLEVESGSGYPGDANNVYAQSGELVLTNMRVVYIARPALPYLTTFAVPLVKLQSGKLVQPWFSANRYEAAADLIVHGRPPAPLSVKFIFNEGGGFEFASAFLQLRSRITGKSGLTAAPPPGE